MTAMLSVACAFPGHDMPILEHMDETENVIELVRLAAAVDDCPTLAEMDAMLFEISKMPQTPETRDIQDSMLDMRTSIVDAKAAGF